MTVLLAPFGIAIGLLVFCALGLISIPMSIRGHFEHRAWLRAMHSEHRTITPSGITDRGQSGTLIVDQPGWGAKAKYCWWTPDDLDSLSPVRITPLADRIESLKFKLDADSLPLDRWIYDTYLSRDSGMAYLVTTKRGDLVATQLQTDMVNLKIIETWSAPVCEFSEQNAG